MSLDDAVPLARQAVAADREQRYAEAIVLYVSAAETLMRARATAATPKKCSDIERKASEYVARAEAITAYLKSHPDAAGTGKILPSSRQQRARADDDEPTSVVDDATLGERPTTRFDDIVGAVEAKAALRETLVLPLRFPSAYRQLATRPWSGILLYGPPGTGKTMLARAAAAECQAAFFSVSASTILSKWLGESTKRIKRLFDDARRRSPAIIFIDEVDALLSQRRDDDGAKLHVKTEFFVQMDGMPSGGDDERVLVLGATNTPWTLDDAALRRFQRHVYVALPDADARRQLLGAANTVSESLVERTEGYSGADIASLLTEARLAPLHEAMEARYFTLGDDACYRPSPDGGGGTAMRLDDVPHDRLALRNVSTADIERALDSIHASTSSSMLERLERWRQRA